MANQSERGSGGWDRSRGRILPLASPFGEMAIVWQASERGPRVWEILLPRPSCPVSERLERELSALPSESAPAIADLGQRIQRFLEGEDVILSLEYITLERCSDFQRRVLLAEYAIPRGWVSTYGRLARAVGSPGAARAVGQALASNPFPIVIPCHRAVRANGELGGYQGGTAMKRVLLEQEGVSFSAPGRVQMDRVYYGTA